MVSWFRIVVYAFSSHKRSSERFARMRAEDLRGLTLRSRARLRANRPLDWRDGVKRFRPSFGNESNETRDKKDGKRCCIRRMLIFNLLIFESASCANCQARSCYVVLYDFALAILRGGPPRSRSFTLLSVSCKLRKVRTCSLEAFLNRFWLRSRKTTYLCGLATTQPESVRIVWPCGHSKLVDFEKLSGKRIFRDVAIENRVLSKSRVLKWMKSQDFPSNSSWSCPVRS